MNASTAVAFGKHVERENVGNKTLDASTSSVIVDETEHVRCKHVECEHVECEHDDGEHEDRHHNEGEHDMFDYFEWQYISQSLMHK